MLELVIQGPSGVRPGFALGTTAQVNGTERYIIFNHLVFNVLAGNCSDLACQHWDTRDNLVNSQKAPIVGFEVMPCSSKDNAASRVMCRPWPNPSNPDPQFIEAGANITFTYDVFWESADETWPQRWDWYTGKGVNTALAGRLLLALLAIAALALWCLATRALLSGSPAGVDMAQDGDLADYVELRDDPAAAGSSTRGAAGSDAVDEGCNTASGCCTALDTQSDCPGASNGSEAMRTDRQCPQTHHAIPDSKAPSSSSQQRLPVMGTLAAPQSVYVQCMQKSWPAGDRHSDDVFNALVQSPAECQIAWHSSETCSGQRGQRLAILVGSHMSLRFEYTSTRVSLQCGRRAGKCQCFKVCSTHVNKYTVSLPPTVPIAQVTAICRLAQAHKSTAAGCSLCC